MLMYLLWASIPGVIALHLAGSILFRLIVALTLNRSVTPRLALMSSTLKNTATRMTLWFLLFSCCWLSAGSQSLWCPRSASMCAGGWVSVGGRTGARAGWGWQVNLKVWELKRSQYPWMRNRSGRNCREGHSDKQFELRDCSQETWRVLCLSTTAFCILI